ncbi:MAG: 4a-hydroxytetrahydrobiopterin dehydratase [Candidatus Omnitrophica bacterium]|nr:4a-hydroxytetrahydrobiopterin dehydratase [Candidatus Omnitrophota bacterium]
MTTPPLTQRTCKPCEGGAAPLPLNAAQALLRDVRGWELVDEKLIRKTVRCKDFLDAVSLIQRIAPIAEAEDHHPDLHLTGYRKLTIELSTHAIGGLSENDFILAAKLDQLLTTGSGQ